MIATNLDAFQRALEQLAKDDLGELINLDDTFYKDYQMIKEGTFAGGKASKEAVDKKSVRERIRSQKALIRRIWEES